MLYINNRWDYPEIAWGNYCKTFGGGALLWRDEDSVLIKLIREDSMELCQKLPCPLRLTRGRKKNRPY